MEKEKEVEGNKKGRAVAAALQFAIPVVLENNLILVDVPLL